MLSIVCLCSILIAGEGVRFDAGLRPQFTARQIAGSSEATRAGLAQLAATEHGRKLIEYFNNAEFQVSVTEDTSEDGVGRAPQPGIATLVAATDHSKTKEFDLLLNPAFFRTLPKGMAPLPNQPSSAADVMALAWAGEMLHIYFYAQCISLPHHAREDFQDDWQTIVTELGMPTMTHDDGDERAVMRRRATVRFIGRR